MSLIHFFAHGLQAKIMVKVRVRFRTCFSSDAIIICAMWDAIKLDGFN